MPILFGSQFRPASGGYLLYASCFSVVRSFSSDLTRELCALVVRYKYFPNRDRLDSKLKKVASSLGNVYGQEFKYLKEVWGMYLE